ncbi:MAG: phosphate-starvation-inducible protein PsiE [Halothiobacillaceae bacterium]|jgi:phosphate starvation-inducible membrane PsiE
MAESGPRFHNSKVVDRVGNFITTLFHNLMLFVIAVATVWSAFGEFGHIFMGEAAPTLKDILLLFIYLEVLAMVGIYFRTHRLPVRFLVYIAITALTRVLVVDLKTMGMEEILVYSGSILILTAAVLALKFGSARYPSHPPIE